jgi:hypothetical protein
MLAGSDLDLPINYAEAERTATDIAVVSVVGTRLPDVALTSPSTLSCLAPGGMRVTWGLLAMRLASRKASPGMKAGYESYSSNLPVRATG